MDGAYHQFATHIPSVSTGEAYLLAMPRSRHSSWSPRGVGPPNRTLETRQPRIYQGPVTSRTQSSWRRSHFGRLGRAVWGLVTPSPVRLLPPTLEAEPYHRRGGRGAAPLADVYLPAGPGPHPSVQIFHGGGFVIGSRRMKPVRLLATRLVEAGFAVAALDYRLILRGGRLAQALDDADRFVGWWHSQADHHRLDPERMSMLGLSAGAALMLMHQNRLASPAHKLVCFFGVYDFANLPGATTGLLNRLLFEGADADSVRERSPISHPGHPQELLLLHGDDDLIVPVEQARRLAERREQLHLPTNLRIYAGAPHGFLNEVDSPVAREAIRDVIAFLCAPGDQPARSAATAAP